MSCEDLVRGRDSFSRRQWLDGYESLSRAAETSSLTAEDLELLARAAYMLGHDDDYVEGLQRAHRVHLEAGNHRQAVRCAFWIGHNLVFRGQVAPAKGWFARAQRLLDREPADSVERGYLQIADLLDHLFAGDAVGAQVVAARIISIGERFGDKDLTALGMMEQGHALVRQGRSREGLRLVDETMIAVTLGEMSPIVAGIVYCNTIVFCRGTFDVRRAREWTAALTRWCDEHFSSLPPATRTETWPPPSSSASTPSPVTCRTSISSWTSPRAPRPAPSPTSGQEGAGQFFLDLAKNATVQQFEPTEYIADGDRVAVLGHERLTARETGLTWDTDWVMVWTIEDGQVNDLREFHQTAAIAQAFTEDGL